MLRPTRLVIDLGRVAQNLQALRAKLARSAQLMAVIKADAYGHGLIRVARVALQAGADALAVATPDEGIALREAGIGARILVLGGTTQKGASESVRHGLAQTIFEKGSLLAMAERARSLGTRAHAHLKLDTGMARIGVRTTPELHALLGCWQQHPEVRMEGAFTHLANADADDLSFAREQLRRFEDRLSLIRAAGFAPQAHAANSAALLALPESHLDMARPGIALYGGLEAEGIAPAQTLLTRPVRVDTVGQGETVGYGRAHTAARDTRVMTLPIGYGDGYPRALSGRGFALVRGRRAPVLGRVCMDQTMLDVTDIAGACMDDEVVLLGAQGDECITPIEMASWADTISYEIMLGFLPRVPRLYAQD